MRRSAAALGARGAASAFGRYLGRLNRALRRDEFDAAFRFGLDDPADTGWAWGAIGPLCATLSCYCPKLHVAPVFDEACFHVDAKGRVSVIPLQLLVVTLAFALSPPMLRAVFAAWRSA